MKGLRILLTLINKTIDKEKAAIPIIIEIDISKLLFELIKPLNLVTSHVYQLNKYSTERRLSAAREIVNKKTQKYFNNHGNFRPVMSDPRHVEKIKKKTLRSKQVMPRAGFEPAQAFRSPPP